MKKREFVPEVKLSVLEEKRVQLGVLQNASNQAINILTDMLANIKAINVQIEKEKSEITDLVNELLNTKTAMAETQFANDNLIKKFEALLA